MVGVAAGWTAIYFNVSVAKNFIHTVLSRLSDPLETNCKTQSDNQKVLIIKTHSFIYTEPCLNTLTGHTSLTTYSNRAVISTVQIIKCSDNKGSGN